MLSTSNLTVIFRDMVRTAMAAQRVASSETTEFYLVRLLEGSAPPARGGLATLFEELAGRFPEFVRVLTEISAQELFRREQDTLRLYKRWLHTRGRREADLLMRRGIIPFAPPAKHRH